MYKLKIDDEEFIRALNELGDNIKQEVADALMETALMIERDAKIYSPIDTGRLRASITSRLFAWNKAVVGSNVKYAPYQEYGTRRGIKPKYYLRRAFENNREHFKEALLRRIARII